MSPRSSNSPPLDIYVGLLIVSTSALLMGIIFLWRALAAYGFAIGGP